MSEFFKEIEITPEIKAKNFELLNKFKVKTLNQTIKMNMIKYFRSQNYKKRIEIYNCKKYDDVDLIKFKKPIQFLFSFVFKDFKFQNKSFESKISIFYVNNLMKKKNSSKEENCKQYIKIFYV